MRLGLWLTYLRRIKEVFHPTTATSASVTNSPSKCNMKVHSIELYNEADVLVAGEIGYSFGTTYTSLTGFYDKSVPNAGKLQLVLLCKWLQQKGYSFWNFGHPPRRLIDARGLYKMETHGTSVETKGEAKSALFSCTDRIPRDEEVAWSMKYKADLGVEVLTKKQFLTMWTKCRDSEIPELGAEFHFDATKIL